MGDGSAVWEMWIPEPFAGVELKGTGPDETGKHGSWSLGLGHWQSEGGALRGRTREGHGCWTPGRRWSARQALLCPLRRRTDLKQEASEPCRVTSLEVGGTCDLHVLGLSLAGSEVGQGGGQSRLSTTAGPSAICRWDPNWALWDGCGIETLGLGVSRAIFNLFCEGVRLALLYF